MSEVRSSYRQIMKATFLFGGVQVFIIFFAMIRVKFVAVLLGTTGVGIMGLLNAPLQLLIALTGLGIAFSAVRDISSAHATGDLEKVSKSILVLRRWSWFTGLLGLLITASLAPWLSQWAFGNKNYTWSFILLSITLLFQAISRGQGTILQGTRRLKDMALASVLGAMFGLITAIPLFYFFKIDGIVPSMILAAITTLILSWYFARKVVLEKVEIPLKETFILGKNMVKLGIVISLTGLIGSFISYILISFISKMGGVEQVGLYNSGWSIIGQYTGLVFTAMLTDYFPRLSAINEDNQKVRTLINQQAEMVALILSPLLILLIIAMPLIIRVLYTPAFLPIVMFSNWIVLGIFLKGIAWPIGFIFPAKGNIKLFGSIELAAMIFSLTSDMTGYYLGGLEGLGISFIINYLFGLSVTYFFANRRFEFYFSRTTIKLFFVTLSLVLLAFVSAYIKGHLFTYYFGSGVLFLSITYSLISIQNRIKIFPIKGIF